ncbi:hypothetical protein NUW46_13405 [Marinobacter sp. MA]|uniref:hypothetical protein n=1 Tax=Marinobacter sp. MA TaxID=2971606 RepID=UPI003AAB17E3
MYLYLLPLILVFGARLFFFRGRFSPFRKYGDFILLLYLFPLGFAIFYAKAVEATSSQGPSFSALLYLSLALIIYFSPLFFHQSRKEVKINLIDKNIVLFLCVVLVFGGFYSIIVFFPKASFALRFGAEDLRALTNSGDYSVLSGSIKDTIAVGFSVFFGLSQLLAFLILATKIFGAWSNFCAFSLIFSSSSYIFNSLAFAGRDGVVFWLFSFAFCYVFVRRWVDLKLPKLFWLVLVIFCVLGGGAFILITIDRFNEVFFIFAYGAQQVHQFNAQYVIDPPLYHGWNGFREILSLLGVGGEIDRDYHWQYYLNRDVNPWTFKFFIGSIFRDFGKVGTMLFLMVTSLLMWLMLIKKYSQDSVSRITSFGQILAIYLYSQVGFMGVFYFKHSALNLYLVVFFLLIFGFGLLRIFGLRWFVYFR